MKRSHCLLFFVTLTLKSCYVYQVEPVSIDQAVDSGKVKVVKTDLSIQEIDNISIQGQKYFAVQEDDTMEISQPEDLQFFLIDEGKTEIRNKRAKAAAVYIPLIGLTTLLVVGLLTGVSGINN